jgi:hypothetical protein
MLVSTAVSISMDISSIGPGTFHAWEVLELNSIFFQKKNRTKRNLKLLTHQWYMVCKDYNGVSQ